MKNFDYLEPTTVAEACALLKQRGGEAKVFAGGSHLTILMKQGLYEPKSLVNIKKIAELKGIKYDAKEGLTIGALVTHRELETSALVKEKFPVLCEAEREVANIRVRNMGTVGGNLASGEPLTDLSQIFISLDAKVMIVGPAGPRAISVEELFVDFYTTTLAEDEILTHVIIPSLPPRSGIDYVRFSSSSVVDKPSAGVAVRLTLESGAEAVQSARIVLGCVGATPVRARKAETIIMGKKLTPELAAEAGRAASQECSPTSDLRGSEQYKRAIVGTLVKRAAGKAYERAGIR
ncbi:MAG TPA: xanthine dehydrogenase family protein subunit M [Candidatus Binatia bacterium]|jgi:carbon-monoxide dehydrogenase medium subunit|nr:xanthine dehydrogenase family protein subunit M [Candidatus Binatia bacterium]